MMMKISTTILFSLLILLIAGMLCSNIVIKKEYDKVDKSDLYWTYKKVLQTPFKYLKITGGNNTHIAFEQSATCSVRIFEDWSRYHKGDIDAFVKNDTLFVNFSFVPQNENERIWLRNITPVRIFAPQLLYVDGFNTNLEMFKMKQKQYTVRMTGKSSFEVESMTPNLDSLNIAQQDSSAVVFEMSPEYAFGKTASKKQYANQNDSTAIFSLKDHTLPNGIKSKEAMFVRSVTASVQGVSLLDVGHAQIGSIQLNIADSSGILLSGSALKKAH
ncbi:hypothetical protein QWZ08_16945 [Ferruginibacter paludis]|uniref:hypothetical protein n=1 Tax=Ferruginibacter paludis TaxID=1310417 RepID=UPI0025B628D6|nr:hypothetical protein [Ferruginibacter paludis]MDN3657341.1 hypothetical protein [Ferruginibacter paludis]